MGDAQDRREAPAEEYWGESASAAFLDYGAIYTPERERIARAFLDLIPAERDEAFVAVDIGTGQGWLSAAILRAFPAARAIALDGSPAMLDAARRLLAPFAGRVELHPFRLEDPAWPDALPGGIRCFVSCLVLHHLDGPQKRALYTRLHERLEPGGALLIADVIAPASAHGVRHAARAWDAAVERQSLAIAGDLGAYRKFVEEGWNLYRHPDPIDKPSPLPDQLRWLDEAGFAGVDVFWMQAGHALFGGYKPARTG